MKRTIFILIILFFAGITMFLFLQTAKSKKQTKNSKKTDISATTAPVNAVSSNKNDRIVRESSDVVVTNIVPGNIVKDSNNNSSCLKLKLLSSPEITPRILSVISDNASITLDERLSALGKLGKELKPSEISALYQFLNIKNSETNIDRGELNALKNDISMLLQDQNNIPEYYAHNLMAMFHDKKNDVVWRDYSVQHLGQWYCKETSSVIQKEIRDLFKQALLETSSSIAGTTLIALDNNAGSSGIELSDVITQAVSFVRTTESGAITRTTALQICARHNETSILDDAIKIAISNEPVPLRMSAIAAIGFIGSANDLALLNKYAASSDIRLRTAATAAIKRLKEKGSVK